MKALTNRVRKLEARMGMPKETESSRSLFDRLEAGRRRVQTRENDGQGPTEVVGPDSAEARHQTIEEILNSGRDRVGSGLKTAD